jgi:hypothetical protein
VVVSPEEDTIAWPAGSSALPNCQPWGSVTLGEKVMAREKWPAGYNATLFHSRSSMRSVIS